MLPQVIELLANSRFEHRHNMKVKPYFTLLILLTLLSNAGILLGAKFYKWVDEQGNTHYSDKAPAEGTETETVHVNTLKPSRTEASSEDPEKVSQNQQIAPQPQQQDDAEMQAYCDNLQKNMSTLEKGGSVQSIDDEGNKQLLSQEEQNKKLEQFKSQYSKNCSS